MTKRHSRNAIAARHRLRIARGEQPRAEPSGLTPRPRAVPDFTINIRSRSGDRLQITATRWGNQMITGDGLKSARTIARGIEMLLRHCAP